MSKKYMSETEARFIIKQHKRTYVGRRAAKHIEDKYDTDFMDSISELRLIKSYIDGFGDGYADARRVTLESEIKQEAHDGKEEE